MYSRLKWLHHNEFCLIAGETCLNLCHWYFRLKSVLHENAIGDWKFYGCIFLWRIVPLLNDLYSVWAVESWWRLCTALAHYLAVWGLSSNLPRAQEPGLILNNLTKVADSESILSTEECRFLPWFYTILHTLRNKRFLGLRNVFWREQVFILPKVLNNFMGQGRVIPGHQLIDELRVNNINPTHFEGSSAFLLQGVQKSSLC